LDALTWKPSQDGNNQNHSAKNAEPTANDATVSGQRLKTRTLIEIFSKRSRERSDWLPEFSKRRPE
jgi:hypothetical protein